MLFSFLKSETFQEKEQNKKQNMQKKNKKKKKQCNYRHEVQSKGSQSHFEAPPLVPVLFSFLKSDTFQKKSNAMRHSPMGAQ